MAEQLRITSPPLDKMDGALLLRVILSDGSERVPVGTLSVHPSVGFRNLQLTVSKMVGLPPFQITSFLVRPTKERIPIDEKMDLGVVSREGGEWHVLAVLQRPRNGRIRRSRRSKGRSRAVAEDPKPQPEKIILRRHGASNTPAVYDLYGPVPVMPVWGHHYQPQIWNAHGDSGAALRENFYNESQRFWPDTWHAPKPVQAVCAVCEGAAYLGVEAAFHCCVRDEVIEVGPFFRSPVGPIERPSRNRVEGCA